MWSSLIPIAAPIIGGMIGGSQASGAQGAASDARAAALAEYAGISIPEAEEMMLNLQQYATAGTLSPELEQILQLGPSAMEQVSTDPRLRNQQTQALNQMEQIANTGMTEADRASFELARQNAARQNQAQQNAIMQEMQQRGQGGAGAELLQRLTASQSGAQMLQQAQLEKAQQQQAARTAALRDMGSMAGNLRTQDFGENTAKANARDAINQFNLQNATNVGARNVASKNNAQAANLSNLQDVLNKNVDTSNKQQVHNKGLQQTTFDNKMKLAGAKAGQLNANAGASDKEAANTAAMWSTIGQGAGNLLAGAFKKQG